MNHADRNQDDLTELLRQIADQTARTEEKKRRDLAKLVYLHDLVAIDIWPACWHLIRPRSDLERWSRRTIEIRRAEFEDIANMLVHAIARYNSSVNAPDVFSGDHPVEIFGGVSTSYHRAVLGLGDGVLDSYSRTLDDPSQDKFPHAIRCFSVAPNLGPGRFAWDCHPLSAPFSQREGFKFYPAVWQVPDIEAMKAVYQWEAPSPGMVDAALVIEYTRAMRRLGVEFEEHDASAERLTHGSCWMFREPSWGVTKTDDRKYETIQRAIVSQFQEDRAANRPSTFFRNLCFLVWTLEGLGLREVAERWDGFDRCVKEDQIGKHGAVNLVKQAVLRVRKHLDVPAIGKLTREQRWRLHDLLVLLLRQQCQPEESVRLFPMMYGRHRGHGWLYPLG